MNRFQAITIDLPSLEKPYHRPTIGLPSLAETLPSPAEIMPTDPRILPSKGVLLPPYTPRAMEAPHRALGGGAGAPSPGAAIGAPPPPQTPYWTARPIRVPSGMHFGISPIPATTGSKQEAS